LGEGWQISTGDFTEFVGPIIFACAALASAFVLSDARRRGTGRLQTILWPLATLALPFVFLPLYLAVRLLARNDSGTDAPDTIDARVGRDAPGAASAAEGAAFNPGFVSEVDADAAGRRERVDDQDGDGLPVDAVEDEGAAGSEAESQVEETRRLRARWSQMALPILYAAALLTLGFAYFAFDWHSFDAHFARAKRAKLRGETARTIEEYRAALGHRDDAHTRKLLGLELLQAGEAGAALAEFRAAARGATEDDSLSFHEARSLDALERHEEAREAYRQFTAGSLCARDPADVRCVAARTRLQRP
jgi:hypothetical protein